MQNPEDSTQNSADTQAEDAFQAPVQAPSAEQQPSLEDRLAEMSDAYLRAKAEGENIRRRAEEEVSKARQLSAALERNKVVEISPSAGTKFDPHQHQAISVVPAEQEANTVVAVLQKGYLIADRVLRPALITVAAPK